MAARQEFLRDQPRGDGELRPPVISISTAVSSLEAAVEETSSLISTLSSKQYNEYTLLVQGIGTNAFRVAADRLKLGEMLCSLDPVYADTLENLMLCFRRIGIVASSIPGPGSFEVQRSMLNEEAARLSSCAPAALALLKSIKE